LSNRSKCHLNHEALLHQLVEEYVKLGSTIINGAEINVLVQQLNCKERTDIDLTIFSPSVQEPISYSINT
ncbi:unnamed protein product, partial [Prunus brigantina]